VAEAGWYADPADPARVRWWDGTGWTDHVQTPAAPAPTGITLEPALPQEPAVRSDVATSRPVVTTVVEAPAAAVATAPVAVVSAPVAVVTAPVAAHVAAPEPAYAAAASPATAVAVLDRPGGFDPEPGVVLPPVRESTLAPASTALRPGAFAASPPASGALPGSHRRVPWVWLIVTVLLLAAVGAGLAFVGLPWWQARAATQTAAAITPVLAQQPPSALARQRQATVAGLDPAGLAAQLVDQGAAWAWASAYGRESNRAFYLVGELPRDQWASATMALEDPTKARELMAAVGAGLVAGAGAEATVGTAREYASPGAGRTWCREIWVQGRTGGHCLWTNGREVLQAVHLPSVETLAAKKTLVALQQLQRRPAA